MFRRSWCSLLSLSLWLALYSCPWLLLLIFCWPQALLYFVFWIYVAIFVLSVSVLTKHPIPPALRTQVTAVSLPEEYLDRDFDQSMQRSIIFHFFHLLWNVQFLIYFSYIVRLDVILCVALDIDIVSCAR